MYESKKSWYESEKSKPFTELDDGFEAKSERVLVVVKTRAGHRYIETGRFVKNLAEETECWIVGSRAMTDEQVTHWQHLPNLPREEEE